MASPSTSPESTLSIGVIGSETSTTAVVRTSVGSFTPTGKPATRSEPMISCWPAPWERSVAKGPGSSCGGSAPAGMTSRRTPAGPKRATVTVWPDAERIRVARVRTLAAAVVDVRAPLAYSFCAASRSPLRAWTRPSMRLLRRLRYWKVPRPARSTAMSAR